MNLLFDLALMVLLPLASIGLLWWLERRLRRPGLFFLVMAVGLGVFAVRRFEEGNRWFAVLLGLQVPGHLYHAWWRHTTGRSIDTSSREV